LEIYADCLEKGIPPQVTDDMDALMYLRAKSWQMSQLFPLKGKQITHIEDWIN
jgi:hypothetical protein